MWTLQRQLYNSDKKEYELDTQDFLDLPFAAFGNSLYNEARLYIVLKRSQNAEQKTTAEWVALLDKKKIDRSSCVLHPPWSRVTSIQVAAETRVCVCVPIPPAHLAPKIHVRVAHASLSIFVHHYYFL